jgi:hypothetical protein
MNAEHWKRDHGGPTAHVTRLRELSHFNAFALSSDDKMLGDEPHPTLEAAQTRADELVRTTGHRCTEHCGTWELLSGSFRVPGGDSR